MTTAVEQASPSLTEGMRERLEAFARLDEGARAEVETSLIRELVLDVGRSLSGEWFTSDDIRPHLPYVNMQRVGRVFAALKREGRIVEVGWRCSKVPSAHGRRVGVYRVAPWLA